MAWQTGEGDRPSDRGGDQLSPDLALLLSPPFAKLCRERESEGEKGKKWNSRREGGVRAVAQLGVG